jgi:hypothetical protein
MLSFPPAPMAIVYTYDMAAADRLSNANHPVLAGSPLSYRFPETPTYRETAIDIALHRDYYRSTPLFIKTATDRDHCLLRRPSAAIAPASIPGLSKFPETTIYEQ